MFNFGVVCINGSRVRFLKADVFKVLGKNHGISELVVWRCQNPAMSINPHSFLEGPFADSWGRSSCLISKLVFLPGVFAHLLSFRYFRPLRRFEIPGRWWTLKSEAHHNFNTCSKVSRARRGSRHLKGGGLELTSGGGFKCSAPWLFRVYRICWGWNATQLCMDLCRELQQNHEKPGGGFKYCFIVTLKLGEDSHLD